MCVCVFTSFMPSNASQGNSLSVWYVCSAQHVKVVGRGGCIFLKL